MLSSYVRQSWKNLRRVDWVIIALFAVLFTLAALAPEQFSETLGSTAQSLLGIAPFLLISVAFAAYTRASGFDQLLTKVFSGRMIIVVAVASVFGAVSPFCSCGVVPIVAALLAAGTPLPGVMAFWLSSPLMDPEMFILTVGDLGLTFAVARLLAAVGIGLLAGYATWAVQRWGWFDNPLKKVVCGCSAKTVTNPGETRWAFWQEAGRRDTFVNEARSIGLYLLKWLSLAFMLESLMLSYVPAETFSQGLGAGWQAVPLAALLGVPAYLNGYAAIPTVSGLLELGVSPGAGLAFMIAGGVTSLPAALAVFPLVRLRVFAWYVGLGFGGALLAGFGFLLV